jgi:predicted DsbA family dithiol-disulfide isomerase
VAPNTADAHRLVLWAEDRGRGDATATALFRAYFSEGRNVSDADVLVDCAAAAGLDADAARTLLDGDNYADAVRESQAQAQRRGITGVPCYVFGDRHAVTGAQPTEVFVEALDAVTPTSSQQ